MTAATALLPCPFCGGSSIFHNSGSHTYVECVDCHASGPWSRKGSVDEGEAESSALWNRRADQALLSRAATTQAVCACTLTEPCSPNCTCANPILSGGCLRCASYGSPEQQHNTLQSKYPRSLSRQWCRMAKLSG